MMIGRRALRLLVPANKPAPAPRPAQHPTVGTVITPESASVDTSTDLTLRAAAGKWATFAAPEFARAAASVGRWHAPGQKNPSSSGMPRFPSFASSLAPANHARASIFPPDTLAVVAAATPECDFTQFGGLAVAGVIAGPTPFINGNPYTLIDNSRVLTTGAVGAFLTVDHDKLRQACTTRVLVDWPNLELLAPKQPITRARGNVVLEIQSDKHHSATSSLLGALSGKQIRKDASIYAALYPTSRAKDPFLIAKITAGDPMRGFLAIDTHINLTEGMEIALLIDKAHDQKPSLPCLMINNTAIPCPHGFFLSCSWTNQVIVYKSPHVTGAIVLPSVDVHLTKQT